MSTFRSYHYWYENKFIYITRLKLDYTLLVVLRLNTETAYMYVPAS